MARRKRVVKREDNPISTEVSQDPFIISYEFINELITNGELKRDTMTKEDWDKNYEPSCKLINTFLVQESSSVNDNITDLSRQVIVWSFNDRYHDYLLSKYMSLTILMGLPRLYLQISETKSSIDLVVELQDLHIVVNDYM